MSPTSGSTKSVTTAELTSWWNPIKCEDAKKEEMTQEDFFFSRPPVDVSQFSPAPPAVPAVRPPAAGWWWPDSPARRLADTQRCGPCDGPCCTPCRWASSRSRRKTGTPGRYRDGGGTRQARAQSGTHWRGGYLRKWPFQTIKIILNPNYIKQCNKIDLSKSNSYPSILPKKND